MRREVEKTIKKRRIFVKKKKKNEITFIIKRSTREEGKI